MKSFFIIFIVFIVNLKPIITLSQIQTKVDEQKLLYLSSKITQNYIILNKGGKSNIFDSTIFFDYINNSDTVTDDFNRTTVGPDWSLDQRYWQIKNGEFGLSPICNAGWRYLAVFNKISNGNGKKIIEISFRWAHSADINGIREAAVALMLDAASPHANGYWIMYRYNQIRLQTIVNGEYPGSIEIGRWNGLPDPKGGDYITVRIRQESDANYFDYYINGSYSATAIDPQKYFPTSSIWYTGQFRHGGGTDTLNHNIDFYSVSYTNEAFKISGNIRTSVGSGISGVAINFGNEAGTTMTNTDGYYSKTVNYGWSGTVTPNKTDYIFSPANRSYNNVTANQNEQNYMGSLINYTISGLISYYFNNSPVKNVNMKVNGVNLGNTNQLGQYNLSLEMGNNYEIFPSKSPFEDIGNYTILTYDAALTARFALGLNNFNNDQQIAADVDLDNNVLVYDAALIARYAVGLGNISDSHVGEWIFNPESRSYINLQENKNYENYKSYILGDVDGNWNSQMLLGKNEFKVEMTNRLRKDIFVSSDTLYCPFYIKKNSNLISFDLEMDYDQAAYKFIGFEKSILSNSLKFISNLKNGKIKLGAYGTNPINQSGKLFMLKFLIEGEDGNFNNIDLKRFQINNGDIADLKKKRGELQKVKSVASVYLDEKYSVLIRDLVINLKKSMIKTLEDFMAIDVTDTIETVPVEVVVKRRSCGRSPITGIIQEPILRTGAVTALLESEARRVENTISIETQEIINQWRANTPSALIKEIRSRIDDEYLMEHILIRALSRVLNKIVEPELDYEFNLPYDLVARGTIRGAEVEQYLNNLHLFKSKYHRSLKYDINSFLKNLESELFSIKLSEEFFSNYDEILAKLQDQISNKEIILDSFDRLVKDLNGIK